MQIFFNPDILLLGIYFTEMKAPIYPDSFPRRHTAIFFLIAKNRQLECPPVREGLNK